eukprot:7335663-Lingulodinium_polyedra.AAC.1
MASISSPGPTELPETNDTDLSKVSAAPCPRPAPGLAERDRDGGLGETLRSRRSQCFLTFWLT